MTSFDYAEHTAPDLALWIQTRPGINAGHRSSDSPTFWVQTGPWQFIFTKVPRAPHRPPNCAQIKYWLMFQSITDCGTKCAALRIPKCVILKANKRSERQRPSQETATGSQCCDRQQASCDHRRRYGSMIRTGLAMPDFTFPDDKKHVHPCPHRPYLRDFCSAKPKGSICLLYK